MISDITAEIFEKSGGSHRTNEGFLLGSMVFMLPVMAYLSLILSNFRKFSRCLQHAPRAPSCLGSHTMVAKLDLRKLNFQIIMPDD